MLFKGQGHYGQTTMNRNLIGGRGYQGTKVFKTFYAAYTSLDYYLQKQRNDVYKLYWNKPEYFEKLNLAMHRGYQAWATHHGFPKEKLAELAAKLVEYGNNYAPVHSSRIDKLATTLPPEFNVRGKWTPES